MGREDEVSESDANFFVKAKKRRLCRWKGLGEEREEREKREREGGFKTSPGYSHDGGITTGPNTMALIEKA